MGDTFNLVVPSDQVGAYRVIIWPLGERFAGLVVKTIDLRPIVREVVDATRWEMNPPIRYAGKNDLVRDVEIRDEIKRRALLSK
jgi:hypothetical protein